SNAPATAAASSHCSLSSRSTMPSIPPFNRESPTFEHPYDAKFKPQVEVNFPRQIRDRKARRSEPIEYPQRMTTITPLTPADHDEWLDLWCGYLDFYETELDEETITVTFERLTDPALGLHGAIARDDDG